MPWWGIVLIGVGGAAVGAGVTYVVISIYIGRAMRR